MLLLLNPQSLGTSLLVALVMGACARSASPYDRLCRIYEETAKLPMSQEVAALPFTRAKNEISELSDDLEVLAQVSLNERYELLKSMARDKAHQPNWQCEAIRNWSPPR